jgi:hypothetical protein
MLNKLKDNMTFDNHGEWEVDHIIPVSSFDFKDYNNVLKCFNYTNLQPLWKKENREKSNKILNLEEEIILQNANGVS